MGEGGFYLVQCERGTGWQNRKTEKGGDGANTGTAEERGEGTSTVGNEKRRNKGAVLGGKPVDGGPCSNCGSG